MKPKRAVSLSATFGITLVPVMIRAILFWLLWWILTEGSVYNWGIGFVSVVLAVITSLWLNPPRDRRLRLTALPGFLAFFFVASIKGGIQVAGMALRPRLDLQPDVIELPLRLIHEGDRLFLAGILNLLPGTLSTGLEENLLRLHLLDARVPIEQEVRQAEAQVANLFGRELR